LCFAALLFRSVPPYAAWSWGVVSLLIGHGLTPGKTLRDLLPAPRTIFAALPIVITTLVLVEVGVRVAFPVRFTPTGLGRIHPENIWAPEPGFDAVVSFAPAPNETGAFRVTLNSLGIRAEEPQPKLPGEYRILFAGDSYTMGWGLEEEKTYAVLTEIELRRRFPEHKIRIINAGIAGYGPWQEFGVLQKVVPAYQPDLVILQTFSANDINDSLAKLGKRMRAFLPEHELMVNTFRLRNRHWPWRCESWLFSHCRAYRVLRNSINMPLFIKLCRELRVVPAFPTPRLPESEPRGWLYEVDLAQWYPELQEGWEMMQADIRAMRDYCAGRGIAFAAFNIPYPVDKGEAVRYLRHYTDPNEYAPDKNARITANFFRREGIPYFTPLQTFREHPNPYSLVYHADGHLTPEGAKVLTGDIVNFLLTKYPENAPWRNHPSPPPSSSPIPNS
ncbi:MAG: SGNH/GDSL hydrolase family protein, partial [Candidatus Hydrogenedentes bacterium]|nr:SGNH/GDSL hydrolase family protein [Candidatus Hydrogenedentota bacterium]